MTRTLLFIILLSVLIWSCLAQIDPNDDERNSTCTTGCRDGLVCLNQTCQWCQNTEQCRSVSSQSVCKQTHYLKIVEHLCLHKNLFGAKISWNDLVSFLIFFVAAAISAGGGIGGGGIFVPILVLVGQFVTKEAVPLSNIIVSGASVANLVQNFPKRHPTFPNKPLIDYSVALLIEPQTLGGTIIGVYLHQIFPSWLILLLLIIVMLLTTIRTTMKGVALFKKEKKDLRTSRRKSINNESAEEEAMSLIRMDGGSERDLHKMQISWIRIAALIVILVISTILSLLKGGGGDVSMAGIMACSPTYWVIAAAIFPVIFIVWGYEGYLVIKESNRRKGIPKLPGEVRWTVGKVFGVGLVSFLAGILASLLGVGGGIIKGPVLIELGLPPEVVAATSAYMIIFTSISASVQYIIIGSVMYDYGVVLFGIGLVASFVGQTSLNWVVEKYKKKSYIIFVIAAVIGMSAILLVVSEVIQFMSSSGGDDHFRWSCPATDS
eukprot:Phypoly_transcript_07651.p1 GENE.Phypoly_transcript_07651~~Phypoly_transcript_07651.p1  ORF type:complete len:492 (+),score=41.04 Phypoly_transcript_07651:75-1550(+)